MRIRIAALSCLFADMILFALAGVYLTSRPSLHASHREKVLFVVRSVPIVAVLLISLFLTVLFVWLWMRRLREEYRQQARTNLSTLIEGTLQDHERKKS